MLTIKQPVYFGYKSAHELPSPPSTSRPSPPLVFREPFQKSFAPLSRSTSPPSQPMSAPHRSLPPPAAMTLAQPSGPGGGHHPAAPPAPPIGQPPSQQIPHTPSHPLGQLPPPPPQWVQGAEESMRAWLLAKVEEEKRKAEEERTRQENLRLEQRKTEHEILRTSLQGGIPPPLVPVVFAGMGGGTLPQAAIDLAHQLMYSQTQQHGHPPQLLPAGTVSPHRRDSQAQAYSSYPSSGALPSTPGSAQPLPGGFTGAYPGSPTTRSRGYSVPGPSRPLPPGSNLPNINTNVPPGAGGPQHPGGPGAGQQPQEPQQSPNIYFHYWQPPTTQSSGGSSSQPAAPSVVESPRKRKATGQPAAAAPPSSQQQRFRSPPLLRNPLSNPPPGRGRGHARQRSDTAFYRGGRSRHEGSGDMSGGASPLHMPSGTMREDEEEDDGRRAFQSPMPPAQQPQRNVHSLSALLSDHPPPPPPRIHQYRAGGSPGPGSSLDPGVPQRAGSERRRSSRHMSEERARGGGASSAAVAAANAAAAAAAAAAGQGSRPGSAATRRDNE